VLTFNDLHTTDGVPYTDLGLVAGTVSLNVHPYVAGEAFFLRTPTDNFVLRYPEASNVRLSSYLDGIAITPQDDEYLRVSGTPQGGLPKGQTLLLRDGRRIESPDPSDPGAFAAWDKWVADRAVQRTAAMADMMKASGLTSPIPGLADMEGKGTFFKCAPYGTCWEPTNQGDSQLPDKKVSKSQPSYRLEPQPQVVQANFQVPRLSVVQTMQLSSLDPLDNDEDYFPCYPDSLRYRVVRDPVAGIKRVVNTRLGPNDADWDWAVCHAGSWIHRHHRYTWVAGQKRHHLKPVRWVKSGHKVGFVPIHPYDVKGRPPINRKEEVFAVSDKNGLSVQLEKFDPDHPIEELKSPPREFRTASLQPLSRSDVPHMEAHALHPIRDGLHGDDSAFFRTAGVPLAFDPKSQSFTMPRAVVQGNKTLMVSVPITNRSGTLQARGGSFAGTHGSFSSSGGARSNGGGGSSGGGGSHAGGGASSAGSSSAASSSGSTSSAGGSHH
jgi:hypothetical protein